MAGGRQQSVYWISLEAKLELLRLAEELHNVSAACRELGISRAHFYRLRRKYKSQGRDGLACRTFKEARASIPRKIPQMPNAFPAAVIESVLDLTRRYPSYSYLRIAKLMNQKEIRISGSGVQKIWRRAGLTDARSRYRWLETQAHEGRAVLTTAQARVLQTLTEKGTSRGNLE